MLDGEQLRVRGLLAAPDGSTVLRHELTGTDPAPAGAQLARHLLDVQGGTELLARWSLLARQT